MKKTKPICPAMVFDNICEQQKFNKMILDAAKNKNTMGIDPIIVIRENHRLLNKVLKLLKETI